LRGIFPRFTKHPTPGALTMVSVQAADTVKR
jgi:hypothetical protein